jgi:hypothetical protein
MARRSQWTYTSEGADAVFDAMRSASGEMRTTVNGYLRQAAMQSADIVVAQVRRAAGSAPAQAGPVATTAAARRDRYPKVVVGGSRRVTSSGAPAGAIMWVAERGGRKAPAPRLSYPSGYFIQPAVLAATPKATQVHEKAVTQILLKNRLI